MYTRKISLPAAVCGSRHGHQRQTGWGPAERRFSTSAVTSLGCTAGSPSPGVSEACFSHTHSFRLPPPAAARLPPTIVCLQPSFSWTFSAQAPAARATLLTPLVAQGTLSSHHRIFSIEGLRRRFLRFVAIVLSGFSERWRLMVE